MTKNPKPAFDSAASKAEHVRREGLPDPAELSAKGIKTRETIDWLARAPPSNPAPALEIDDEQQRKIAKEKAHDELRKRANELRRDFQERSRKTRKDFETARSWRGQDRER